MPIDILIYGVIAGFMVLWLRSLLGTRNEDEPQRPNPFEQHRQEQAEKEAQEDAPENVASIHDLEPAMHAEPVKEEPLSPEILSAISNKDVEAGLVNISKIDRDFSLEGFLENAKDAFVIIIEAFAEGDRETLQELLAQHVYVTFEEAITEREKNGERVEQDVHSVREALIKQAWVDKKMAFITVRFVATETSVITSKSGDTIAGDPNRVSEKIDVWTFGRNTKSGDPRWFLYETQADDDVAAQA